VATRQRNEVPGFLQVRFKEVVELDLEVVCWLESHFRRESSSLLPTSLNLIIEVQVDVCVLGITFYLVNECGCATLWSSFSRRLCFWRLLLTLYPAFDLAFNPS